MHRFELPRRTAPPSAPEPGPARPARPTSVVLIRVGDLWRHRTPGDEPALLGEHLRYVAQWADHREAALGGTVVGQHREPGEDDLIGFVLFDCDTDRVRAVTRPGAAASSGLIRTDLFDWYPYDLPLPAR